MKTAGNDRPLEAELALFLKRVGLGARRTKARPLICQPVARRRDESHMLGKRSRWQPISPSPSHELLQAQLQLLVVGEVLREGVEAGNAVVRGEPERSQHGPLHRNDVLVWRHLGLQVLFSERLLRLYARESSSSIAAA